MRATNRLVALIAIALVGLAAPATLAAELDTAMNNFKSGKYLEAAAEFQSMVDQSPSYDFGFYMMGLSFLQMGKSDEAPNCVGEFLVSAWRADILCGCMWPTRSRKRE